VRVLFTIHHELNPDSGAPGVTAQLAQALREAGHDAEVFSWSDLPARLGPHAREALFPAFVAARIRRAAAEGVDVIDASTADAALWLASRRRRRRGPAIATRTHGLEHTFRDAREAAARAAGERIALPERAYHGFWRLRETELTLRRSDAALFLNAADRRRAVDELGVQPARAHVVANGIPDAFAALPAPQPRAAGEPLRVVQLGAWDPRKGVATTAAALGPVLAAGDDVVLTLLGTGDAAGPEDILAAFPHAARQRIRVKQQFTRDDLPGLLAGQHVLVQPSLAEGFSLALVEAMACGLAPVASAVGAAPELLGDAAERGLVVAPGDAPALRAAIERLRGNAGLLERLRGAAQARARELTWLRVARDTAGLYAEIVRARSTDRS
jgi:glycosyltransferase involved in cell wall biosynthesis